MAQEKMIIGIDPGLKGAVTFLKHNEIIIKDLKNCIADTGTFHSLNPVLFQYFIDTAIRLNRDSVAVFCEESILLHKNGIMTPRIVYDSRGVLRTVFELRGIPVNWVAPITWKSYFGLRKTTKEDSVKKAIELLPEKEKYFYKMYNNRKILLDGRAESALIALYGRQATNKLFE
jgi:hypothetical protein